MIQRQHLPTTLRHLKPLLRPSTCRTCTCRCGSSFQSPRPPPPLLLPHQSQSPHQHQQRRQYARKSPSVTDHSRARRSGPLTPTQRAAETKARAHYNAWFSREIASFCLKGSLPCTPEQIQAFLSDFSDALTHARGQNFLPPESMHKLLAKHTFPPSIPEFVSRVLLRDDIPANIYKGKKLLYSLSKMGYVESTIRVMAQALMQDRAKPGTLKSREIAFAREHLTKVAREGRTTGGNYRAMVLEGRIALALKNEEYAIEMFNKAMDAAVEASEAQLANPVGRRQGIREDALELTAPWHELMQVHATRSRQKGLDEWELCEAAMEIGCQQDDPLAHLFKADHVKQVDDDGIHTGTSDWLYHITKAACSGVPRAAYELGVFYAESGWKYIEDEPPEHVKPTPFDAYPGSSIAKSWFGLLQFAGVKKFTPQELTFHSAIFPSTAVDRLKIALEWLNQAMEYHYAPAYLMTARLYNRKTLWAQADAPSEALQLKNERYTYASKQDYEAGKPLPQKKETAEVEDPPNPLYNPEEAQRYLREIFDAYDASRYETRMKVHYEKRKHMGTGDQFPDPDEVLNLDIMLSRGGLPAKLGKWFKFPEVREVNAGIIKGLWEEAKELCEEEGWVLVDEEGGLVYKSGLGERRL